MSISTTLSLNARALLACSMAYEVVAPGPFPNNGVVFLDTPTAIVDGPAASNACLVGRIAEGILVAFRGTLPIDDKTAPARERIADWCEDFRAVLVTCPGLPGRVHAGFLACARDLIRSGLVNVPRQSGDRIIFTGHSKGGAVALISALLLPDAINVVTFSAPRTGDDAFVQSPLAQMCNVQRFEASIDIVPHVPPHASLLALLSARCRLMRTLADWDYQSAGTLSYVNGGTISPAGNILTLRRELALAWAVTRLDADGIIAAHSLSNYRDVLGS